jgi:hypothetical protein
MAAGGDRQRHARVKEIFGAAMRWAAEDRAAVVAALAGDEADVRDEVLSLLAHHDDAPLLRERARGTAAERDPPAPREAAGLPPAPRRTLAALLRAERAGAAAGAATRAATGAASGSAPGWPADRVVRALDPIAREIASAADQGAIHGRICLECIVVAADDELAADLAGPGSGPHAADAEPRLERAHAACAAPEQLLPALGPVGPWTDVYRLALVCVELMLGRPVTDGSVAAAFARARDLAVHPTPRAVGLDVPSAVETVLARALATRPIERYQDVDRLWTALRDSLTASPPDATPSPPSRPSGSREARRLSRERGAWALPAAAIGIAIAAALAFALRCG